MDFWNLRQHHNRWYKTTLLCLISFCIWNSVDLSIHVQTTIYSCCMLKNNGNWTNWSAIWSDIVRMISKPNKRAAQVRIWFMTKIAQPLCHFITSILKSHNFIAYKNYKILVSTIIYWTSSLYISFWKHVNFMSKWCNCIMWLVVLLVAKYAI